MNIKVISVILFLFHSIQVSSKIKVDVSVIVKKGIGSKDHILTSELYSSEIFFENEKRVLQMRQGPSLNFQAYFDEDINNYGPSDLIKIEGLILSSIDEGRQPIGSFEFKSQIGVEKKIFHEANENQLVEIVFIPHMF